MRHAPSFENERVALPAVLGDRHTVTMETAGPHFDTGITALGGKKSPTLQRTSKLSFSICNVP